MVGVQVGNEQEERKGEKKRIIREIKDFIVPNNAGEDFCGSDDVRHDDMMYDMMYDIQLQFGGERRERRRD